MIVDILASAIGAFGGTVGFCLLQHSPRRTILPAATTGMIGFTIYLVLCRYMGASVMVGNFAATVAVTVICEILARAMRLPSTVFLLSSLVTLVPGYSFYSAMLALVRDDGAMAASQGMTAVQIVAAIAVGAAVTSVCFRTLTTCRKRKNA